jgi:aspartyl protease family protein
MGVIIVTVILLRDNTTLFNVDTRNRSVHTAPSSPQIGETEEQSEGDREAGQEEQEEAPEERAALPEPAAEQPAAEVEEKEEERRTPDQMVVDAGPGGHFFVKADIDGNEVGFLVDTGASMVALSSTDAEQMGYSLSQLEFTGRANTANGIARFAPIMLSQIAIGDIVVNDVQAVIMEGPMSKSLLGMTFLRKLEGFEIKNDQLIMRW